MIIYNRDKKETETETEYKSGTLNFLYNTVLGRILLNLIIARPWFSNLKSLYQKSRFSKKDIAPFAKKYGICVDDADKFKSFNDFFTRKREIPKKAYDPCELLAIADGKLRYYPITDDLKLKIKNSVYELGDIIGDAEAAQAYKNGVCMVFRLSVDDFHRYHYPDNGQLIKTERIKGKLHTVRPISEKYKVFAQNSREVSLLKTENMGQVIQIEVGALLVGKIKNHGCESFSKMQEKGYFEFGGSTIVILMNKHINFDPDIAAMNAKGIETKVRAGERIGTIC